MQGSLGESPYFYSAEVAMGQWVHAPLTSWPWSSVPSCVAQKFKSLSTPTWRDVTSSVVTRRFSRDLWEYRRGEKWVGEREIIRHQRALCICR